MQEYSLLSDDELDTKELETEKKECIGKLISFLLGMMENNVTDEMTFIANHDDFQVTWRKACRLFHLFSRGNARCSASNIEALLMIAYEQFPELKKILQDRELQIITNIQDKVRQISNSNLELGIIKSPHIGPIELLDNIGADGFGKYTPQTELLYAMMAPKDDSVDISGYRAIFNQWIATHLVDEASILSFLNHQGCDERGYRYPLTRYLDASTVLLLLSRVTDWMLLYTGYGYQISFGFLIDTAPEDFLQLIQKRGERAISQHIDTVIKLLASPGTQKETVFAVATIALDIEKKRKEEEKNSTYVYFNGQPTRSDKIRSILARRFPDRYLDMLEERRGADSTIGDAETQIGLAKSQSERYLTLVGGSNDKDIFTALISSLSEDRGSKRISVFDILIEKECSQKVIELLFRIDISHYRMLDFFEKLARANPQGLVDAILAMKTLENRSEGNIYDNPLQFRKVLQHLVLGDVGEQVLNLLDRTDPKDINIHTHALLHQYVSEQHSVFCSGKDFDFEMVAREMVNDSKEPLDKLVRYLVHYAFIDSAMHSRDSYNQFLAWDIKK